MNVFDRPFLPDECTHLVHTPHYANLTEQQQLAYNQLFGLRINEQFIMFEEMLIVRLVPRVINHPTFRHDRKMTDALDQLLQEEKIHTRMFADFNRQVKPDLYLQRQFRFVQLTWLEHALLNVCTQWPGLLPGLMWLMLALEELTTALSEAIIQHKDVQRLDNQYIKLHKLHLQDEKRHVGIDRHIVQGIVETSPAWQQGYNAYFFRQVFSSIIRPQRSTLQVIHELVHEFNELEPAKQEMLESVRKLDPTIAFPGNLVTPNQLPVTFRLLDRYPAYKFNQAIL